MLRFVVSLFVTFAVGVALVAASPATAAAQSSCTHVGTDGPETITGTEGDDYICALGGDDIVDGLGGNDTIVGGAGADTISGGGGLDRVYAGLDNDTITGDGGPDRLYGESGNDDITGGFGADYLYGEGGDDILRGEGDADRLAGGTGNDELHGQAGADRLLPGDGDDSIVDGGTEVDLVDYTDVAGPVVVDLATGSSSGAGSDNLGGLENANGTAGDDHITASPSDSVLGGMGGDDQLVGGAGKDLLLGGVGHDTLTGNANNDTIRGEAGIDVATGGTGRDKLYGGDDDDSLGGDEENDYLYGDAGVDTLLGGDGHDRLTPGTGTGQYVDGQLGSDTLAADDIGEGVEINLGGATMNWNTGSVEVNGVENATGTAFGDIITGDGGANVLQGMGSGDVLSGLGANDSIYGGGGDDTADGGLGADAIFGEDDSDTLDGGDDDDFVSGGGGGDALVAGGRGADSVVGGDGADVLSGGEDNDYLDPGAGDDAQIDGGSGQDGIVYAPTTGALTIDLDAGTSTGGGGNDQFTSIESAYGGGGDDTIFGGEGTNDLAGRGGNDTVNGRGGDDDIYGGPGDDSLRGGPGADEIFGQDGTDTCGEASDIRTGCELAFNEPPILTIVSPSNTYTEDEPAKAVDGTLTLTDDEANTDGATVTIDSGFESGKDILSVGAALPAGVTASYVAPTLTISGTATVAQYQAILRSVRFQNTSQDPSLQARSILFSVTDGEFTDSGNEVFMAVQRVNDKPVATPETYSGGTRGVRMRVGTTHGDAHETEHTGNVLNGDTDVDTPAANLTATPGTLTSTDCAGVCPGNVTMQSDGTFVYDPPAGDDGTDSFTYTVEDNDTGDSDATEATHTATVTLTRNGPRLWFVDDSAAPGGRGVSHAPLQSLTPLTVAGDKDGSGDRIFVYSGVYTGGIALEANQALLGEPNGLNVGGTQFVAAGGTKPRIGSGSAHAVTVASGTAVEDVELGSTPGAFYSLHAPVGTASYTVADTDVNNTSGGAMHLADGTPTVTLGALSSNNASGNGLRIETTDGGSVSSVSGTLSNASGATVSLSNANSSLTLGSNIDDDLGQLIALNGGAGATTFNGSVTDGVNGTGNGVTISNTAGAVNFTKPVTLSTGANNAFTAANNTGSLRMVPTTGASTLATTDGAALTVSSTPIHSEGLSFRSISAQDLTISPSTYGIQLENTGTSGTSGSLTVTGNGVASSGGTITGKSTGIRLANTTSPSFSWMKLHNHGDFAIYGNTVSSFKMDRTVIDGAFSSFNGNDDEANEGAVSFDNLTGTGASITNSTIAQGIYNDLRVVNTTGTLNRLTVSNTTFSNTSSVGNDAILLEGLNSAVLNATIQNSTFQSVRGDHIDMTLNNSAQGDVQVLNNTLTNSHPTDLGGGINADVSGSGHLTYAINGNTLNGAAGSAIVTGKLMGGAPADGTAVGTINNNVVGTSGVPGSGSELGSGIDASLIGRGKHSVTISGNQIRQYRDNGILLTPGGGTLAGVTNDGDVNYTVTNNTVTNPAPTAGAGSGGGIHLNSGANSGDVYDVCLNMQNNNLSGSAPAAGGSRDIVLRQRFETVVRMPNYGGAEHNGSGTLTTDVTNYLTGRSNTFGTLVVSAANPTPGGGGYFNTVGGAACSTS